MSTRENEHASRVAATRCVSNESDGAQRRSSRENPHFKARERETRTYLTPGQPAIMRMDGRAFHSYCKGLQRPFDGQFVEDMDRVMLALTQMVDGVRLAYVQSDEISLLLTDHIVRDDGERAEQGFMFGGQVQKLVSIAAAIASTSLNALRYGVRSDKLALFDARAFSVADMDEAREYFAWRQEDARRNSLSMLASTHFSHRQLHGIGDRDRVRLLRERDVDPNAMPAKYRDGRTVVHESVPDSRTFTHTRTGEERTVEFIRRVPVAVAAPDFADPEAFAAALNGGCRG